MDTGEEVHRSGDGTVGYQSLRVVGTWADQCDVEILEYDGVTHRGIADDAKMLARHFVDLK